MLAFRLPRYRPTNLGSNAVFIMQFGSKFCIIIFLLF